MDTISVDNLKTDSYPVHNTLLKNNILIIENLTNLDKISQNTFTFGCMPLNTECTDGAPVRAFAMV